MSKALNFYSPDELVADMVVDPDATHAQSKYTQGVLVVVSHRLTADCMKRRTISSLTVAPWPYQEMHNQTEASRLFSSFIKI